MPRRDAKPRPRREPKPRILLSSEEKRARARVIAQRARRRAGMLPRAEWLAARYPAARNAERQAAKEAEHAVSEARRASIEAGRQVRAEKAAIVAAERNARMAANDRRRRELIEARKARTEKYLARNARREAELAARRQLKEQREKEWAEKRRALTPAERKDRARRSRRKKSAPWLRQSGYRAELWAEQQGRCGLTGAPIPEGVIPHLDHIVAKSKGGPMVKSNLQWVHPMANHAKNSHTVEEFRTWLLAAAEALKQKMQLEELL